MKEIGENLWKVKNWRELSKLVLSLGDNENINLVCVIRELEKKKCKELIFGKVKLGDNQPYALLQTELAAKFSRRFRPK